MNLKEILARIESRLDTLGLSAHGASELAGKPDAIRNLKRAVKGENKRSGINNTTIEALAPVLETTAAWLLHGEGDDHIESAQVAASLDPEPVQKVKIKGYVGAGSRAHYYALADEEFDEVDAPLGATEKTVAVEIRGKSLGPLLNSWLVFYDDVRSPVTDDLVGHLCVVGLSDDRILVKQIVRNRQGGYDLISNTEEDPIRGVTIEWAAKVTDLKPRF